MKREEFHGEDYEDQLTGPRILLICHISLGEYVERWSTIADFLSRSICEEFPGITVLRSTGYWRSDGQRKTTDEDVDIISEETVTLLLQTSDAQKQRALERVVDACRQARAKFDFSLRYLHVEEVQTNALHVDLDSFDETSADVG